MKVVEIFEREFEQGAPVCFSYEFFPPKTEEALHQLYDTMVKMKQCRPTFCDVSWGALGQTFDTSLEIARCTQQAVGMETQLHMTCTGYPEERVVEAVRRAKELGVCNILALRGMGQKEEFKDSRFQYAVDLVRYLREEYGDYFGIAVAGYPGGHYEAPSYEADLQHLKEKIDAGADMIVSPMFYDVDVFLGFVKDVRALGIEVPILPGIMPIQDYAWWDKTTKMAKTIVPPFVHQGLEPIKEDPAKVLAYGIQLAVQMCQHLVNNDIRCFHLYSMNNDKSIPEILRGLKWNKESPPKPFPWAPSYTGKRRLEGVRPIHWNHRPHSYMWRTSHWEEFPHSEWEVPEGKLPRPKMLPVPDHYLTNCYVPEESSFDRRLCWCDAPTEINHIQNVFLQYHRNKIPALPWIPHEPHASPEEMREEMQQMVMHGYWPINWQVAHNGVDSENKNFGWGPAHGSVFAKHFVEFFCSASKIPDLLQALPQYPHISFVLDNASGSDKHTNLESPTAVCFGTFPNTGNVSPTVIDPVVWDEWREEAFTLWKQQWGSLYPEGSPSRQLIDQIHDTFYLVSLVDNRMTNSNVFQVFSWIM